MGAELGLPQRCAEQPGERGWLLGLQLLASHRVGMELISLADAESYAALPLRGKNLAVLRFQCYLPSSCQSSHCFTNDINSCNGD